MGRPVEHLEEPAMKFPLLAAVAAVALGSQTASAQPIVVPSGYSPGATFGGTVVRPGGLTLGGFYSPAPSYYARPIYAGPVLVPVRPVVAVVPVYGPGYFRPLPHRHHGYRW